MTNRDQPRRQQQALMADPVGTAVGVVALAGLFNNALDTFNYIQLGRSAERDIDGYLIRLHSSRLRLSRWGEAVGLDRSAQEAPDFDEKCPPGDLDTAYQVLVSINRQLQEAEKVSVRLSGADSDSESETEEAALAQPSTYAKGVLHAISKLVLRRQGRFSLKNKIHWVVSKRNHLLELVQSVSQLVDDLTMSFKPPSVFHSLCMQDATEVGRLQFPVHKWKPIQLAIAEVDKDFANALEDEVEKTKAQLDSNKWNINFTGNENRGQQTGIFNGDMHNRFS